LLDHRTDFHTAAARSPTLKAEQEALTPAQVLESLQRGNARFVSGKLEPRDMRGACPVDGGAHSRT